MRSTTTAAAALSTVLLLTLPGCTFQGVNSLPLPGAVGRGPTATTYYVDIANVGTLEPNSPVLIDDVFVGSIRSMRVANWHAHVDVSVKPGISVPANAVATVGQTSLLGSMHLALDPPPGQQPSGRLAPGAAIPLNRASTYPSTEQTLSALSVFINSGGVSQIGDIVHNANLALGGREQQIRDTLTRLDTFIGALDRQRDNFTATIEGLDRLTATLSGQTDTISAALRDIPPALAVLIAERPRLTDALNKLRTFSTVTTRLINDSQADLISNLNNLQPTLAALADLGPRLDEMLGYAAIFPLSQDVINRAVRGDYLNLFSVFDLTIPRLKRTLFRGTRWGDITTQLVPAPGEPYYQQYTYNPLAEPVNPSVPALDGAESPTVGTSSPAPAPATPQPSGAG
jgi:phospholipid/cholesterol/gamma-HCH transport system substrate-binding protein